MDRASWLLERRAVVRDTYDAEAPQYDRHDLAITSTHREFVNRLLESCPPGGTVLDVPCGTGKYFALVEASGRRVIGIDQSSGMLAQARAKGIAASLEQGGLQELALVDAVDGSMTVDAMENVPPEDWPLVLANLHRAVRRAGHLYFTVEEIDEAEIDAAYARAQAEGSPAIRGELVEGDVAGYHYYPTSAQIGRWLADEGLEIVETGLNWEDGWGYRHYLVRTSGA